MAISSKTENLRALSCSGSVVENKKSLNETLFTGSIGRWKVLPLVAISRMSVNLERRYHPPRPLFIRSWLWICDKKNITRKWWEIKGAPFFVFYAIILTVTRRYTCVTTCMKGRDISLLWKGTRFSLLPSCRMKNIEKRDVRCFNVFENINFKFGKLYTPTIYGNDVQWSFVFSYLFFFVSTFY